mmetsp:Transcript_31516/g.71946  ORF Transcript_31516/g.71946 Transcript_31516/m.71946 type:complete len:253 (-) Transcript_31516:30-788(-)
MASFTSNVTEGLQPGINVISSSTKNPFSSSAGSASPASAPAPALKGGAAGARGVCAPAELPAKVNKLEGATPELGGLPNKLGLEAVGSLVELLEPPNKLLAVLNKLAPVVLLGILVLGKLNKLDGFAPVALVEPPNKLIEGPNKLEPAGTAPAPKIGALDEVGAGEGTTWLPLPPLVATGTSSVEGPLAACMGCFAELNASANCPASSALANFKANFSLTCSSSDLSKADQHQILSLLGIGLKSQYASLCMT